MSAPADRFMPHGMCFMWNGYVLSLHAVSDALTALAYYAIALTLLFVIRKRGDVPFRSLSVMFAIFILACATTHLLDIWTIWHPVYWLSGIVKALTAAVSIATAVVLVRGMPAMLALKSPAELAELNRRLSEKNRLMTMAEQLTRIAPWRLDVRTGKLMWSQEIYLILDLPLSYEPQLASALEFYHPNDRAYVAAAVEAASTRGIPFTFEARIARADGTFRDVACSGQAERTENGTIAGVFGVFQDVTERKDAEQEREQLLERLVIATQSARAGIWEWNMETNTLVWDRTMFAIYGCANDAFSPTYDTWSATLLDADRQRAEREFALAKASGGPLESEFRIVWPNGEIHSIRALATVVRTEAGLAPRMIGTNWDVTEVSTMTEQLRQEKERLIETVDLWTVAAVEAIGAAAEANRAKSQFFTRMSHEIRTPMNGIIGFCALVLDSELTPEQREHMTYLRDAGQSLLSIINDVLDFSKIEAGKLEVERIAFDPRQLVDSAAAIIRCEAARKGIALSVDVAANIAPWVIGDPARLRQILLNLLTNAVKFTPAGSINVRLRSGGAETDDLLCFEIDDSGIGIPSDRLHLLFQDFAQIETSTSRQYGGTGLGLAISQRLVGAMGGTIGVTSVHGEGSRFWFTARLPATTAAAHAGEPGARVRPSRILVVDDNAINQIVVAALLRKDGHDIVLAGDGAQALAAVRAGAFDLVLMDMQMPVLDGVQATRAIRRLPGALGRVPIVALTANALREEVTRCLDAGMDGHLAKPIEREALRRAISLWGDGRPLDPLLHPAAPH